MPDSKQKAQKVKQQNEQKWLSFDGVTAVGIGLVKGGEIGIIVSVKNNINEIRKKIPDFVEGVTIEIQQSGEFKAQ